MKIYKLNYLILSILFLATTALMAQPNPNELPLKIGDEVTFKTGDDAKRFVVIGMEGSGLTCAVLNDEEKVDTVSMKRMAIIGMFPKPINRKRMSFLLPNSKLKWKQRGKLVEGYLVSYSPADPNLTVKVYLDSIAEERRVPVKYATPSFGESRIDTLKFLNKLWESDTQLFSYDPDDMKEQGIPQVEEIVLTKTTVKKPYQYVMEDNKFVMVSKKDLNSGIVGSWKIRGDLMYVTTKFATVYDEVEEKKVPSPCPDEHVYKWKMSADGRTLKLSMIGFVEPEPEEEVEIGVPDMEEDENMADDSSDKPKPPKVNKPNKPKPKVDSSTSSEELERVRAELEALKEEFKLLREALKEKEGN